LQVAYTQEQRVVVLDRVFLGTDVDQAGFDGIRSGSADNEVNLNPPVATAATINRIIVKRLLLVIKKRRKRARVILFK